MTDQPRGCGPHRLVRDLGPHPESPQKSASFSTVAGACETTAPASTCSVTGCGGTHASPRETVFPPQALVAHTPCQLHTYIICLFHTLHLQTNLSTPHLWSTHQLEYKHSLNSSFPTIISSGPNTSSRVLLWL